MNFCALLKLTDSFATVVQTQNHAGVESKV